MYNHETYYMLREYGYSDKQIRGIENIWDFFCRLSVLFHEDFKDQYGENHERIVKVDDFKLIKTKVSRDKMGLVKEITDIQNLPFRTALFFNNFYTNIANASSFFNIQNRRNGLKWLVEKVLRTIPNKWNLSDWVQPGLIAHISAININNHSGNEKREYN